MKKEQQTIKKIQELVPEIMELKFGCRVKFKRIKFEKNKIKILLKHFERAGIWKYSFLDDTKNNSSSVRVFHEAGDLEILGRDITLEDILLTIGKIFDNWNTDNQYNLNYLIKIWQFNKSFHEQSQETKNFIGDLILKN